MKKNAFGFLVILGVLLIGIFIAIMIVGNHDNDSGNNNVSNSDLTHDYFDSYSYTKNVNGNYLNISLKYYKDDFKFEESCYKVYYDIFVNDQIVRPYREGSPYEVDVNSLVFTSNYCKYDNSDTDDVDQYISKINEYVRDNSYIIKEDKEYLGIILPVIYVSNYNEFKLLIINSEGNNIFTSYIQKQKEDILSMDDCKIKYNKSLYGKDINVIKAGDNSFYYLKVDAHLLGEVNTFTENRIVINNDEVDTEIVGKCSGK